MGLLRSRWVGFVTAVAVLHSLTLAGVSVAIMRRRAPSPPEGQAGLYDRAAEAAESGDCGTALPLLERALETTPEDADALSLRGYCQRKSGRLEEAFESYHRALAIRPEFPAARQYLGEAHLQAALRELDTLRTYGEPAREEIEALVGALRAAAGSLTDAPAPPGPQIGW